MLSEDEYYTALHHLHNVPSKYQGTQRQNYRRRLKKQIKEYEYNIKYTQFTPLPYIPYHVNRNTPIPILQQLIQAATSSTEFTLDTESMKVYKAPNRPALIQVQILLPYNLSLVVICEMMHLPPRQSERFTLIAEFFKAIFTHDKSMYIWGTNEELLPFTQFQLFTHDQIDTIKTINLQKEFKSFWQEQHPHRRSTIENPDSLNQECHCETCIGKNTSELWSLQDAIAYSFNEYLPKLLTEGDFHIGLDEKLADHDQTQQEYRRALTTYALNDCLSMQRIIISMKEKNFQFERTINEFIEPTFLFSPTNDIDDDDDIFERQRNSPEIESSNQISRTNQQAAPPIAILEQNQTSTIEDQEITHQLEQEIPDIGSSGYPMNWESLTTNENQHESPEELTERERRIKENRRCTIRQRRRYYRNELVFENIDRRFTVNQIKSILKRNDIPIYVVNPVKQRTKTIKLFVAVREPENLSQYEERSRNFFTSQHYQQLKKSGDLPRRNR
ncbi:unnamed protein product [Adineta ricciae]|uniref:Uncharacterized protein n=1 Tax=Adineta ricciae TaxID=249248 RepID=A0A815UE61_ADIRI|nr:unnamed protein product [Adineta ricciae]